MLGKGALHWGELTDKFLPWSLGKVSPGEAAVAELGTRIFGSLCDPDLF